MMIEEKLNNHSTVLYICHFPPKVAPVCFVCMYFASAKYIFHVKLNSLLVETICFVLSADCNHSFQTGQGISNRWNQSCEKRGQKFEKLLLLN